jgi:hypothetical protein
MEHGRKMGVVIVQAMSEQTVHERGVFEGAWPAK